MRLVLDSNIIIAAFATRGLCAALFEYCLESHDVILCEEILEEVSKILHKKIKVPKHVVEEVVAYLRESGELMRPAKIKVSRLKDKSDLSILGTAVAAGTDFLIAGDAELLKLKKVGDTSIISPRTFWEEMRGEEKK